MATHARLCSEDSSKSFPAEQTHGKRKAEAFRSRLHSKPTVNTLRKDLATCRFDVVHREYASQFRYDGVPCPHLQNVVRDAVGDPRCRVVRGVARKMRTPGGGLDFPMAQQPPDHGAVEKPGRRDSLCPYLVFDFGMLRDVGTQGSRSVGTVAACLDAKIATAEVVHVDASLIRADFADGE